MTEPTRPPARPPGLPWPALGLVAVVVLVWSAALTTPYLANALGLGPTGAFFDLQGILAANEAAGRGLDPYGMNPLDAYQRPFLYSTWWLWPGLGLTRAATGVLGWALVAATLAAVLLVWRVRSWREALIGGLILLSPAWLLAVYRANNDLVILVLLALTGWALQRARPAWRAAGALLTGAMTILKYYPVAAVIGLLHAARRREVLVLFALTAGMVMLGWSSLAPAITAISRYGFVVTASVGFQAFGLKALGESLAPFTSSLLLAGLAGGAAGVAGWLLAKGNVTAAWRSSEGENRLMTAAVFSAVLVGCWVIGTSYSYKLVFLWGLLPWLVREAPEILGRKRTLALLALVVAASWSDGLMMALLNTFAPGWSRAGRLQMLDYFRVGAVITQLAYWVIMGACLRLSLDWSRRQVMRLSTSP